MVDGNNRLSLEASCLPAPLHLLPSIARSAFFSKHAKSDLYRLLPAMLMREAGKTETAIDYMRAIGCTDELMQQLIEPMIVSALNEKPHEASAKYARMAVMRPLIKNRSGYRLGVPEVAQSNLIGNAAYVHLESKCCDIRLLSRVVSVQVEDGAVRCIELASGEKLKFDAYVVAIAPDALAGMGVGALGGERLAWRPIVSAHLIFDGQIPPFEPTCVVGQPFGWVFSKRPDVGYVELVASAACELVGMGRDELLALARRAAATVEPTLKEMPLRKGIICRLRRATFATLACDAHRPDAKTLTSNLFFAGDWTNTGWPATIESAVRSGRAAARAIWEAA